MHKRVWTLIFLALCALVPATAGAAWLDPNLEDVLADTTAGEYVKALVVLDKQVDLRELVNDFYARRLTLEQRHYEALTALRDQADSTQGRLIADLSKARREGWIRDFHAYWITNAITVWAKPAYFETLRTHPDVGKIFYSYPIELIEPVTTGAATDACDSTPGNEAGVELSRAPELWDLGIDGSTALAGDCDTGADGAHVAFASRWRGLSSPAAHTWFDPVTNTTFPFDSGYHGTHTLGTIVGANGIGMAPGAQWIAAGTVDRGGLQQTIDDSILAFQWFADPDGNPVTMDDVPDVINNSWGISPIYHGVPYCDEQMWAAIDGAEAAGVVVVFAAGNEGPGAQTLRTPGDRIASDLNTFSIGALNHDNATPAGFSSRGPSGCDGSTIKPEVSAVGVDVCSSYPGNSYGLLSGTSMATPHVAGAVVLLRDAFPEAMPEDVKFALYETAVDIMATGEDNDTGKGAIDVVEAYLFLQDYLISSDGKVNIDAWYSCDSTIQIAVNDDDLDVASIQVSIDSDTDTPKTVTLSETANPGVYRGSIATTDLAGQPSKLRVAHGDTVVVTYIDADDGEGHIDLAKTDQAQIDCQAPTFAGLDTATPGDEEVTLDWNPGVDDTSIVYNVYRSEVSGDENFNSPIAQTSQTNFVDSTVANFTTYYYVVRAADVFGQEENNVVERSALPTGPDTLFFDDFETDTLVDWEIEDGGSNHATWTDTNPGGRHSNELEGVFASVDKQEAGIFASMDESMITPPIDCSSHYDITLRFANDFEAGGLETADVDFSLDSVNWTRIHRYRFNSDSSQALYDLPSDVDYAPELYIRFHYSGGGPIPEWWGVDNVWVRGWRDTSPPTTTTTVTTTTTTTSTTGGDDDTDDDTDDDSDDDMDDDADDDTDDDTDDDWIPDDDTQDDDDTGDDDFSPAADDDGVGGNNDDGGCGC